MLVISRQLPGSDQALTIIERRRNGDGAFERQACGATEPEGEPDFAEPEGEPDFAEPEGEPDFAEPEGEPDFAQPDGCLGRPLLPADRPRLLGSAALTGHPRP